MISYLGVWGSLTAGVWFLFSTADNLASAELKAGLAEWLKRSGPQSAIVNWPKKYIQLFESLFGPKHFSQKCVWRSFGASLISFTVVGIIYASARWESVVLIWNSMLADNLVAIIIPLAVLANAVPDYLSLLETRILLNYLKEGKSFKIQFLILALDFILSGIIFYACVVFGNAFALTISTLIYGYLASYENNFDWNGLAYTLEIFITTLNISSIASLVQEHIINDFLFTAWVPNSTDIEPVYFDGLGISYEIFRVPTTPWLYSTFLTSIWIYLFLFSSLAIRTLFIFSKFITKHESVLQLQVKPIAKLGYILILAISFGFAVAAPFAL